MYAKLLTVFLAITNPTQWDNSFQINPQETHCLVEAIYHEARGEPAEGQAAVATVVLNRVKLEHWPSTICEVVYQKKQFSWTRWYPQGKLHSHNHDEWISAQSSATSFMIWHKLGLDYVNISVRNATFFSTEGFNNSRLAHSDTIGGHKFYELIN